jgi:hypothetical protein
MAHRINRAIELLQAQQPIYYVGGHTGHVLTFEQGRKDARTWADYINVGMEHGAFDMSGLDAYMRGLVDGGPTNSRHRTPTVIVEAPVDGSNEPVVRYNAWQFRQILARGVHGILLCQAESAGAVRAFVESCRYPIHKVGIGTSLGIGTRGRGAEPLAASVWGVSPEEYMDLADAWPLNPNGGTSAWGEDRKSGGDFPSRADPQHSRPWLCRDGAGRSRASAGLQAGTARPIPSGDAGCTRAGLQNLPGAWHRLSGDLHARECDA